MKRTMRYWLKEMRENKGLSQQEAAAKADITQGYYCNIENGAKGKQLPVHTAKAIAKVLGFEWTRFFEEEMQQTWGNK